MATWHVGTSGFAYPGWVGTLYPEGTRSDDMLRVYASRLGSVEINYTFRREAGEATVAGWRDATPEGFVFALKAYQRITHWLRLANAEEAVAAFLARARALGPRLGPILFQCPPNLAHDRGLIEGFLAHLPPAGRYAFEFRHPSWLEARPALEEHGAAWCTSDTDERPSAGDALADGPFAYVRLRRTAYTEEELRAWADRIAGSVEAGSDVFCFVKHEEAGAGLALRLTRLLEARAGGQPLPPA